MEHVYCLLYSKVQKKPGRSQAEGKGTRGAGGFLEELPLKGEAFL